MIERSSNSETVLEVLAPDKSRQSVPVTQSPFFIGRGGETDNNLQLPDGRISRRCAAILIDGSGCHIEDRGNRYGLFVNGVKIQRQPLHDSDLITFGVEDSYQIVFHAPPVPVVAHHPDVANLLTRIGTLSDFASSSMPGGLSKLNLLLEATSLLHSQLPLDSVLGTMLDHAISITHADRGLLMEPDADGVLRVHLARGHKADSLPPETLNPSQTAVNQAISRRSAVITEDLNLAGLDLKAAESVVIQGLRAVVAIPLYSSSRATADTGGAAIEPGQLLGVIYLDSRRIAAFTAIDRQILDALAVQAASILDNARLVERERERQRLEQELSIARNIQQALLPQGLNDFPHLAVTGVHYPCHEVGGDYFDVVPVGDDRTAILIADVSGKGLGAALVTTMLQGALSGMSTGADPVKVFCQINKLLCRHSEVGRYATMFIGHISSDGAFEYIKAGHPSPLLLRQGKVSELYTEGSFPVGLIPEAEYACERIQLEPEDTLVLFSDGVTEAENPQHELFEVSGLSQALSGLDGVPVEAVQKSILESVRAFSRGASQSDDITVLVVRYRASV
jgi:serine phosphatase RsbU (regulator of sigma subunit)